MFNRHEKTDFYFSRKQSQHRNGSNPFIYGKQYTEAVPAGSKKPIHFDDFVLVATGKFSDAKGTMKKNQNEIVSWKNNKIELWDDLSEL